MKLRIQLNSKPANWTISINNYLFITINMLKCGTPIFLGNTLYQYMHISKMLRQFGLIKPLKNYKNY